MNGSVPVVGDNTLAHILAHLRVGLSSGTPHAVAFAEHVQTLLHLHMDDDPHLQHSDPLNSADRVPEVGALSVTTDSGRHFLLIVSEVT